MGGDSSRRGYSTARRKVMLAIILNKMNPASRWDVSLQVGYPIVRCTIILQRIIAQGDPSFLMGCDSSTRIFHCEAQGQACYNTEQDESSFTMGGDSSSEDIPSRGARSFCNGQLRKVCLVA